MTTIARPLAAGAIAFSTATMTSVAAMAACGGAPTLVALSGLVGPPSITATEASTDQALELIRKRREEASSSCPTGFTRSGGNCVPLGAAATAVAPPPAAAPAQVVAAPPAVTTTTTTGPAPATAPQQSAAAPAQVAQAPATRSAAPPPPSYSYSGGSIKDGIYDRPMPGVIRATGLWAEGYYDHEKHGNLAPGQQANPSRRLTSASCSKPDRRRVSLPGCFLS